MHLDRFQKWALATLLATVFLVFVGGVVRVSGAGLGCPDWPKCWGQWFPPASAEAIAPGDYDIGQFNRLKMWTEYLNRLVGVAIGLLVLGTFWLALADRRSDRATVWASGAAVALVVFQGWLGGRVVKSGLAGGMVTVHLACAVVLVALLVWVVHRAAGTPRPRGLSPGDRRRLLLAAGGIFACGAVQVVLGAGVREAVDEVNRAAQQSGIEVGAGELLESSGWRFPVHRTFAWTLVAGAAWLWWAAARTGLRGRLARAAVRGTVVLVAVQIASGVSMAYFAMPPVGQVVHLGSAVVLCALAFLLVLQFSRPPGVVGEEVSGG